MSSKKKNATGVSTPATAQTASTETFTAEDLTYQSREFYNPANDDNGISVRLFFRCPPQLERELETIRDNHRFPYKTMADIVRHAVARHIEFCHRIEPDLPKHWIGVLAAINEVCQDADMMRDTHKTFERMEAVIQRAIAAGDSAEAMRLMSVARSAAAKHPESKWRKEWLAEFEARYGHYLTPAVNGAPMQMGPLPTPIYTSEPPAHATMATPDEFFDGESLD